MRDAYLMAAESAIELLHRSEVATRWDQPSALAEWTVGGLAGHLASQVPTAHKVLATAYTDEQVIKLPEHYENAAWVKSGIEHEVNVSIRSGGDAVAAAGPAALVESTKLALVALRPVLDQEPTDRIVVIPWQGWALSLDDFLVTRMMEIAVHSDDLAASVGIEAPALPAQVLEPVLALLTDLAVRRHGQSAVLSALTRRERAPGSVSAF